MQKLNHLMVTEIDPKIYEACHGKVLTGPFCGMEVGAEDLWGDGNNSLKTLGLYERELHPYIIDTLLYYPRIIVNVGCSSGYYAIGLAMRLPESFVHAFDIDARQLGYCEMYAEKNKVRERMNFTKGCQTADELNIQGADFFLLDCEGAELTLLNKQYAPVLEGADIIVECHDFSSPGLRDTLIKRFSDTHNIRIVEQQLPDLKGFSFLAHESVFVRALTVVEKRPLNMSWLVMRALKETTSF